MEASIGYGQARRLIFDGNADNYESWELKFFSYMRIKDQRDAVDPASRTVVSQEKKEKAFAELIQHLDDRSIQLIRRDANQNGRTAIEILREHYAGTSECRILSLITTLATMSMSQNEDVTDYVIRCESAANALEQAGEPVSDRILNALVLKGLPPSFKQFRVHMEQQKKVTPFLQLKKGLRNFEENERASDLQNNARQQESIMRISEERRDDRRGSNNNRNNDRRNDNSSQNCFTHGRNNNNGKNNDNENRSWNRGGNLSNGRVGRNNTCYRCGASGHKSFECPKNMEERSTNRNQVWCDYCESPNHTYQSCRNRNDTTDEIGMVREENTALSMNGEANGEEHSFVFAVREGRKWRYDRKDDELDLLMVDSGSTHHIINDKKNFIDFDSTYLPEESCLELADGRKIAGAAERKGTAEVKIRGENGKTRVVKLTNALYAPSFPHNIFSVKASGKKGARFLLGGDSGIMTAKDGTRFPIYSKNELYFLNLDGNSKTTKRSSVNSYYARFINLSNHRTEQPKTYSEAVRRTSPSACSSGGHY